MTLQETIACLQQELSTYPQPVTLIAVTKYASQSQMISAYEAGIRHFGENKVQDALLKKSQLPVEVSQQVQWHLVGHLQKNKVQKTLQQFDWIHSVDSLALAQKLSQLNLQQNYCQNILLQVNIAEEATKFGFSKETIQTEFKQLIELPGISIQGLMMIAPADCEKPILQKLFLSLQSLKNRLEDKSQTPLPQLSMGMSQDFSVALDCGATMIRLGNMLFS